jgi:hypothetical protein
MQRMRVKGVPLWMRMATGSVAILLLFGVSVLYCIFNLNSIATKVNLYNKTSQLVDNLYTAQDYQGTYLLQQEDSSANAFKANIAAVIKLIAERTPEVSDPSLLDLLAKLKSNIVLYNQAFDSVVANTKQIRQLKQFMTQAYEAITRLLAEKVKAPLEEKKNNALIIGNEISAYEQELLSVTDRLYTVMATTRLNENNFFMRSDPEDMQRVLSGMAAVHATFEEWSYLVETLDDKAMATYPQSLQQPLENYSRPSFEQIAKLWIDNQKITATMLKQKDVALGLIKTFQTETANRVDTAKSNAFKNIVTMLKDIAEGEGDLISI